MQIRRSTGWLSAGVRREYVGIGAGVEAAWKPFRDPCSCGSAFALVSGGSGWARILRTVAGMAGPCEQAGRGRLPDRREDVGGGAGVAAPWRSKAGGFAESPATKAATRSRL